MNGFLCLLRHRFLDQVKYNERKYAQYQQGTNQGKIFKEKDFEHRVLRSPRFSFCLAILLRWLGNQVAIFGPFLLCDDQTDQDSLIYSVREKKSDNFLPGERLLFSTLYIDMVSRIRLEKCGLKYDIYSFQTKRQGHFWPALKVVTFTLVLGNRAYTSLSEIS